MSEIDVPKTIEWRVQLEEYMCSMAEKAYCFAWLHKRATEHYSKWNVALDLPVIILSAINGAISVGSNSLFNGNPNASVAIGGVALLCSVLNTITSYFSWAKRSEGHRICSIQYAKLYRFISVEMSLPREERTPPPILLKYIKEQYDRMAEISPLVPPKIISLFNSKFGNDKYKHITKPEECNTLEKVEPFDNMKTPPNTPIETVIINDMGIRTTGLLSVESQAGFQPKENLNT